MILGTGIDVIEIERIAKAIERWGDHFLHHVFLDNEITYARRHKSAAAHFAVRFAAKEAVFKAVGTNPQLSWKDIRITNDEHGRPRADILNHDFQDTIYLSLSHSKYYAVASAIITKTDPAA
ncbi:MAG: holo-ACP synthase [Candidatus Omnitrophica bacterium]|nr:holo-ACP synthase [Candidatus Omnitrophota bacterium]MCB9721760.1 holo-ACP synthase [Candidatus Omnitrophota bacterium]